MFLRDLLAYIRILRKRWWLILALFVTTVSVTALLYLRAESFYRAWVTLQVGVPLPTDVSLYSGFRYDEFRNEVKYTQSAFTELLTDQSLIWRTMSKAGVAMEVEDFLERTTIEAQPGSSFITVAVEADTPEAAQLLATTWIEEALSYYGSLQARPTTAAKEFIAQELEAARIELAEAERALAQFKVQNKIGNLDDNIRQQQNLVLSLLVSRDSALAEGDLEESANYDQIITERERQMQELVSLSTEYESLITAVNLSRETYNLLLSKETEAKIKENQILNVGSVQIISPAQLPSKPIPPFGRSIILLSGVVSLAVGVMVAFVWEYVETQLHNEEQSVQGRAISVG
jgi:uncharacterized protein involved in exopolysaccharide biosynthesis